MNDPLTTPPVVACFGEILWDCLPRGLFLGGAPLNVAYHLGRLGLVPRLIGAVGWDFLGEEALRRLAAWGLESSFIVRRGNATGTVRVDLDEQGAAGYAFDPRPAWDYISVSLSLARRVPPPAALVFGTLALRESANRSTLEMLLDIWPDAARIVDLNLRPPFDRAEAIDFALSHASLLKLNLAELAMLVGPVSETPEGILEAVRRLAQLRQIERICVTAGARGAGLFWKGEWHWREARPIVARDTVGAGDAFLAALLAALLREESPPAALGRACDLAEFVATQDGATPDYAFDADTRPVPREHCFPATP